MSVTVTVPVMEQQLPVNPEPRAPDTDDLPVDDDIRNGIPKLSTLAKWKAGFGAHERAEAKRRRKLDKGKQVERVWNGVEGRPAPAAFPVNEEVEQSQVNHRVPLMEDDSALGSPSSGEERSRSGFSGRELPLPPPPTRSAPAVPRQPAISPPLKTTQTSVRFSQLSGLSNLEPPVQPPPTRSAPPGPALPAELPSSNTIPVSVRLSKLERVKQMTLKSAREVNAREIRLSKSEVEKMRTFSEFVGTPNQITLFGRRLPQCHRYAVQLELDGSGSQTYICIEGLRRKEDICDFHAVMSQRKYRKYYEPWKICFRMVDVSNCAAVFVDGQGREDSSARFKINQEGEKMTLCRCYVNLVSDDGDRVSTIGGIIQLGSELYALTTAHTSRAHPAGSTGATSPAETLRDDDFPDDVDKVLVLMAENERHDTQQNPIDIEWSNIEESVAPIIHEHQGDDWCLIPLPVGYQLPNADWTPLLSSVTTAIFKIYDLDPAGISVGSFFGPNMHTGTVSWAPSFLDGERGPIEVWAVHLDTLSPELSRGDSGLWFLSPFGEALGSVVGRSPGKALITPLSRQFQSISRSFPDQTEPTLPDPILMLLRAAKNTYEKDPPRSDRLIHLLFSIARMESPPQPPSRLHRTLQTALRNWGPSEIERLKILILISGGKLEGTLKGIINEQSLAAAASGLSTAQKLAIIYRNGGIISSFDLRRSAPMAPATLYTPKKGTPTQRSRYHTFNPFSPFSSLLTASSLTPEPPPLPSYPVSQVVPNHEAEPYSTLEVYPPPEAAARPNRTILGLMTSAWDWLKDWYLVMIIMFLGLSYWAGIGIGAWKLLTSGLSSGLKIGIGVGLIVLHLFSLTLWLLWRRRLLRATHHEDGSSHEEDSNGTRIMQWMRRQTEEGKTQETSTGSVMASHSGLGHSEAGR